MAMPQRVRVILKTADRRYSLSDVTQALAERLKVVSRRVAPHCIHVDLSRAQSSLYWEPAADTRRDGHHKKNEARPKQQRPQEGRQQHGSKPVPSGGILQDAFLAWSRVLMPFYNSNSSFRRGSSSSSISRHSRPLLLQQPWHTKSTRNLDKAAPAAGSAATMAVFSTAASSSPPSSQSVHASDDRAAASVLRVGGVSQVAELFWFDHGAVVAWGLSDSELNQIIQGTDRAIARANYVRDFRMRSNAVTTWQSVLISLVRGPWTSLGSLFSPSVRRRSALFRNEADAADHHRGVAPKEQSPSSPLSASSASWRSSAGWPKATSDSDPSESPIPQQHDAALTSTSTSRFYSSSFNSSQSQSQTSQTSQPSSSSSEEEEAAQFDESVGFRMLENATTAHWQLQAHMLQRCPTGFSGAHVYLNPEQGRETTLLEKMALSDAFAAVTHIDMLENMGQKLVEKFSSASRGAELSPISRLHPREVTELTRLVGEATRVVGKIDALLFGPDFYWNESRLGKLYDAVSSRWNVRDRCERVREQLEASTYIASIVLEKHRSRYEIILVWIIVFLVGLACVHTFGSGIDSLIEFVRGQRRRHWTKDTGNHDDNANSVSDIKSNSGREG